MPSNAITVIHKFIRRELFDFSQQLFRAGPDDVPAIVTALQQVGDLLRAHSSQEELRLEPQLRLMEPDLADRLTGDHRRLDDFFEGLLGRARILNPTGLDCSEALLELHLDWNRFLSAYLAHLDDEERTLFRHMAAHLPPLATLVDSARAQGARGEEFLLRLWAVTTCQERAELERAQAGSPEHA
jgi:hypothetical protein